jgi:plasmid rolling circle replication initiator protein Rep
MPILSHDEVKTVAMFSQQPKFRRLTALKKAAKVVQLRYKFLNHPNAAKMAQCSPQLRIRFTSEITWEGLETKQSYEGAHWCRVRWCPICMAAKESKWMAKFLKAFASKPRLADDPQFIFITLTVKNCKLSDLRATIAHINKAWTKMVRRTDSPIEGYLRSLEITAQLSPDDKSKFHRIDGEIMVHPHFHAILAVPSNYFEKWYKNYHSFEKWRAVWKKALGCDYDPIIYVKKINPVLTENGNNSLVKAVAETFKYCIKPTEFVDFGEDSTDYLQGITEQMQDLKAITIGGYFKKHISQEELDKIDDTLEFDEAEAQVGELMQLDWLDDRNRWQFSFPDRPAPRPGIIMNY